MASARTSDGKAIRTSRTRMITVSVNEPQNAAKAPSRPPTTSPMTFTANAISSELRPP